jgi:A/G-specific adenine glycosylase
MAQQTQVQRVVLFYNPWLKRFPTLTALARASKLDVLTHWSGLGYNNRALRLHRLAREVVDKPGAILPRSIGELRKLPGVGRYTAHAVACFAFGQEVAVVDVNIRRVFSRMFWSVQSAAELKPEKDIWSLAEMHLPALHAAQWNQALMDLGALICTARRPLCAVCPINSSCASAFSKNFAKKIPPREKMEPSFKGVPRRIYRGRILKALHKKPLTSREIGMSVVSRFHPRDLTWIESVLKRMEFDDLVTIRGTGNRRRIQIAE